MASKEKAPSVVRNQTITRQIGNPNRIYINDESTLKSRITQVNDKNEGKDSSTDLNKLKTYSRIYVHEDNSHQNSGKTVSSKPGNTRRNDKKSLKVGKSWDKKEQITQKVVISSSKSNVDNKTNNIQLSPNPYKKLESVATKAPSSDYPRGAEKMVTKVSIRSYGEGFSNLQNRDKHSEKDNTKQADNEDGGELHEIADELPMHQQVCQNSEDLTTEDSGTEYSLSDNNGKMLPSRTLTFEEYNAQPLQEEEKGTIAQKLKTMLELRKQNASSHPMTKETTEDSFEDDGQEEFEDDEFLEDEFFYDEFLDDGEDDDFSECTEKRSQKLCLHNGYVDISTDEGSTWQSRYCEVHEDGMFYTYKSSEELKPYSCEDLSNSQASLSLHNEIMVARLKIEDDNQYLIKEINTNPDQIICWKDVFDSARKDANRTSFLSGTQQPPYNAKLKENKKSLPPASPKYVLKVHDNSQNKPN